MCTTNLVDIFKCFACEFAFLYEFDVYLLRIKIGIDRIYFAFALCSEIVPKMIATIVITQ
jgi:hypothetical protein